MATGSGDFGHQGARPACCCPPTVIHRTRGFPSPQCLLTPAFRSAFHHLPSLCSFAFSRGLQHPPQVPQPPRALLSVPLPCPRPSEVQPKKLKTWAPSGHLPTCSITPGPWRPQSAAKIQGLPRASKTPPPATSELQPPALGTAAARGAGRELVILFPLEQSQASSQTPPPVINSSLTSLMTSAWGGSSSGEQSATGRCSASQPSGAWSPQALSAPLPALLCCVLLMRITRDRFRASVPHLITRQVFAKPPTLCPAFPRTGAHSVPPLHLSPWPSAQLPPHCFAGDKGVQAWRQLRAKPGEALRSHALALALPKHLEAFQH